MVLLDGKGVNDDEIIDTNNQMPRINEEQVKVDDPSGNNEQSVNNFGPTGQGVDNDEMIDTNNQIHGCNKEH